jgi:5-formyltetrahydrofolate cyclo-ligase
MEAFQRSKAALRYEFLRWRDNQPKARREAWSHDIARVLIDMLQEPRICSVMGYFPIKSEADIRGAIEWCWRNGITVALPAVVAPQSGSKPVLKAFRVNAWKELAPGAYGIPSPDPERAEEIAPDHLDVVMVPGAAFDRLGGRIGYGGGFYDRFLPLTPAKRVGIAYSGQVVGQLPLAPFDCRVHIIVTESGKLTS